MHPISVPAHCTPKFSNICLAKRGKHAPTSDRSIVLAAKADAALDKLVTEKEVKCRALQVEVRIQKVIPSLHEYCDHAEAYEETGCGGSHPMDRRGESRPSEPALWLALAFKEIETKTYQKIPPANATPPTIHGSKRHSGTGTLLLSLSFSM